MGTDAPINLGLAEKSKNLVLHGISWVEGKRSSLPQ
jgi:hypothetical protein